MATPTYKLIHSVTLSSSASSVTLNNIDQSYGDLILVSSAKKDNSSGLIIRFNGDSSSIYSNVYMDNSNGVATSAGYANQSSFFGAAIYQPSSPNVTICQVFDYSTTNKYKNVLLRSGMAFWSTSAYAGLYGSTAAVTSITFDGDGYSFAAGATFNLYGIEA